MIPKKAIEKAISGGWKDSVSVICHCSVHPKGIEIRNEKAIALDPSFWQALGKALGYDTEASKFYKPDWAYRETSGSGIYLMDDWQNMAHTFFDLILTNGDTKKFWEEILKS